ncbi:MAG: hypothetical protein IPN44_09140 [Flavobacteriales bacterium]|nr:hypothetical protein [Flavobacteriales bacterium]
MNHKQITMKPMKLFGAALIAGAIVTASSCVQDPMKDQVKDPIIRSVDTARSDRQDPNISPIPDTLGTMNSQISPKSE